MDSVLEKITLYDILGYLFPGCILMMMTLVSYKDWALKSVSKMGDNTGILYFAFFLISYLAGIAVSEAAAIILLICKKTALFILKKPGRERRYRSGSWKEEMILTLKKSGICNSADEIRRNIENDPRYYMSYMYGIVQCSQDYKRIHNYRSACVMYKNMVVALMAGDGIMYFNHAANDYIYIGCLAMCVLLMWRYYRFAEKMEEYTVIWFIDKYNTV